MASVLDVSKAFYNMKPESYADRLESVVCAEKGRASIMTKEMPKFNGC